MRFRAEAILVITITSIACTPLEDPDGSDTYDSYYLFDCLTDPVPFKPRSAERVTYVVPVVDFDTQLVSPTPVAGAELVVCTSAACDVPFLDWQRLPSPSPALWILSFPFNLRQATLRFTAPGYVGMDYVLGGPLVGTPDGALEVRGIGVPLVSEATYSSLHGQVGSAADPTRGTFAARVLNCDNTRYAGASVEPVDVNQIVGSIDFALSNNNLASGAKHVTDARGVAGFFNVPAATFDVEAWTSYGARITAATVPVRAGVITLAELRPGLEVWGQ